MGAEYSKGDFLHVKYGKDARDAKDVLRIHRKGQTYFYYQLPYYPDMQMFQYLAQVIAPELGLALEDDDSVYHCIGWLIPHTEETIVVFDQATRLCRLGDVIAPDSDLFWMPIEDDRQNYTHNAAP